MLYNRRNSHSVAIDCHCSLAVEEPENSEQAAAVDYIEDSLSVAEVNSK